MAVRGALQDNVRAATTWRQLLLLHYCNTCDPIEAESCRRRGRSLVIRIAPDQDEITSKDPASNRMRRGQMDELIGRLAAKAGIDDAVAEKTIGIILGFLRNEGPSDT